MATSDQSQRSAHNFSLKSFPWSDFLWWLLITVGAGLMQVWALLIVILGLQFWPDESKQMGIADWGIARVLGNSVLVFFATSLIGQAVYTIYKSKGAPSHHRRFAEFFIASNFILVIILYVLTVLFGEPPVAGKYSFDIFFTVQALAYAAYVEFRLRRTFRSNIVQEPVDELS